VTDETVRICLWSGPRNVSTAVMYAFRERPDTSVVDEPLYAHYLAMTGVEHPAVQDVIAAQDTDGDSVVETVILGPSPTPVRFFKNMAHHLGGVGLGFLDRVRNVILTRDPVEMLPSLINQVPEPTLDGTSLPRQVQLLDRILEQGQVPIVLESRSLLADPEGVLRQVCDLLDIGWEPAMLSWPEGPKPEDGVWAPHWYDSVHRSTGFDPYRPREREFPARLKPLLAACEPLYARLAEHALT
jgi:hypothetical protein